MTLKDIAKECGVSMMTVSNVISGNHKKVSAATIEKVNAVIKKYDYVPNLMARTLSSKSSHLILLVIPTIKKEELSTLYNQYLTELISSIERELVSNGYFVLLHSVAEPKEIEMMYKTWNIDGAIFLLPLFNKMVTEVNDYDKKNFVLIDSYADIPGVLYSRCDDELGTYRATSYLISKGHTRILYAAEHYAKNLLLERRYAGYVRALKEHNLEVQDELYAPIVPNYYGGLEYGKSLTRDKLNFTGVVTTSDMCALGIMQGARENGLHVPEDFSLIGFDNLSLCNFSNPKLTSIDQQTSEKGVRAVHMLLDKLQGKEVQTVLSTETELVSRESVRDLTDHHN